MNYKTFSTMKIIHVFILIIFLNSSIGPFYFIASAQETVPIQEITPNIHTRTLQKVASLSQSFHALIAKKINSKSLEQLKEKSAKPKELAASAFQSMFFILAVTTITLVIKEVQKSGQSIEKINTAERIEYIERVLLKVLDSGGIWSGLASQGIVGYIFEKPVSYLSVMLNNTIAKKLLVSLLSSGIDMAIKFALFDFGYQLWEEARLQLSKEDYARSFGIGSLTWGTFKSLINPDSKEAQEDRRVFIQTAQNMGIILLFNHELRSNLWYNFFSKKILTGEFCINVSAIVGSMVGGTELGSTLAPGLGTAIGSAFGLVAGVGVQFIPKPIKDDITLALKHPRLFANSMQLDTNLQYLEQTLETPIHFTKNNPDLDTKHNERTKESLSESISSRLQERGKIRDDVMNIFLESHYIHMAHVHEYASKLKNAEYSLALLKKDTKNLDGIAKLAVIGELSFATESGKAPTQIEQEEHTETLIGTIGKLKKTLDEEHHAIEVLENSVLTFYEKEKEILSTLLKKADEGNSNRYGTQIAQEFITTTILKDFLVLKYAFSSVFYFAHQGNEDALGILDTYYLRVFSENKTMSHYLTAVENDEDFKKLEFNSDKEKDEFLVTVLEHMLTDIEEKSKKT